LRAQAVEPADRAARVEALYAEGSALYRERKYRAAIERFRQAFALYPDPNLLYNIARSHEALGELQAAITGYRQCLEDGRADESLRLKARERLTALEETHARVRLTPADPRGAGTVVDDSGAHLSRLLGPGKWILGGTGLALLVAGAVAYGLGAADHGKVTNPEVNGSGIGQLTRQEALDLRDSGQLKKNVGLGIGAVGVGALVGAAVLLVVDSRRRNRSSAAKPARSWLRADLDLLTVGVSGTTVGVRGQF
jgi:tetratricopeptide (TPR) repeat protein